MSDAHLTTATTARSSVFFGNFVIFAAFVGMVLGPASVLIYSFGVFVGPLEREFGWTRGQISLAATVIVLRIRVDATPPGRDRGPLRRA